MALAGDYSYDKPHLLGTMRTGPDLMNIGVRQPGADWHLGHLYQPRAYVSGSIMPSYPYLFDVKDALEPGDKPVTLPRATRRRARWWCRPPPRLTWWPISSR